MTHELELVVKSNTLCDLNTVSIGCPRWLSGKQSVCQCKDHRKHGFDPWVTKILRKRKLPNLSSTFGGKSHGQRSLVVYRVMAPMGSQRVGHNGTHTEAISIRLEAGQCMTTSNQKATSVRKNGLYPISPCTKINSLICINTLRHLLNKASSF